MFPVLLLLYPVSEVLDGWRVDGAHDILVGAGSFGQPRAYNFVVSLARGSRWNKARFGWWGDHETAVSLENRVLGVTVILRHAITIAHTI